MDTQPRSEPVSIDSKLKHLELIQGVIDRMGSNSFRLKGWAVVLVSAILILVAREDAYGLAFIGLVPVGAFWGLDAYYLRQERLFRSLYDQVRELDAEKIDFSMDTSSFTEPRLSWRSALLSKTLRTFYIAIAIALVVAVAFSQLQKNEESYVGLADIFEIFR